MTSKTTHKLDFIKIKDFYALKDTVKRIKKSSHSVREISANHISDKEYVSKTNTEFPKLSNKKIYIPIRKLVKDLSRYFTKEAT